MKEKMERAEKGEQHQINGEMKNCAPRPRCVAAKSSELPDDDYVELRGDFIDRNATTPTPPIPSNT